MGTLTIALASWLAFQLAGPQPSESPATQNLRTKALKRAMARQKSLPDFNVVYHLRSKLDGVAQDDVMRSQLSFSRGNQPKENDGLLFLDFAHQSASVNWRDWPNRVRVLYRPNSLCTEWPNSRLFYHVEPRTMPLQLVEDMFLRTTGFRPPGKGWGSWVYRGLDLDIVTILGKQKYSAAVAGEPGVRRMTLTKGVLDSIVLAEDRDWRMVSRTHDHGRIRFRIDEWRHAGGEWWPSTVISDMVNENEEKVLLTMDLVSIEIGSDVERPSFQPRPGYLKWDPEAGTYEQVMGGGMEMFEYQRRFVKPKRGLGNSLDLTRAAVLLGGISLGFVILRQLRIKPRKPAKGLEEHTERSIGRA